MPTTKQADTQQATLWNGSSGHAWIDAQPVLDQMFRPMEAALVDAVRASQATRVLDVGCGTGTTTLAAQQLLGMRGHCTGVDVSAPMIGTARARAQHAGSFAEFICADAQSHAFDANSFDMLISRFGVMFFDHPVQAFENLKRAAQNRASMCLIAWRSAAENPFMTVAERAAASLLTLPTREPGAPGQFAFADRQRVATILMESGWNDVTVEPVDFECTIPESELVGYFTRLGPLGIALQQADDHTRLKAIEIVRPAYDSYVSESMVHFTAACWMIRAGASPAPR
jgi:SAM-dependent methyltransferase